MTDKKVNPDETRGHTRRGRGWYREETTTLRTLPRPSCRVQGVEWCRDCTTDQDPGNPPRYMSRTRGSGPRGHVSFSGGVRGSGRSRGRHPRRVGPEVPSELRPTRKLSLCPQPELSGGVIRSSHCFMVSTPSTLLSKQSQDPRPPPSTLLPRQFHPSRGGSWREESTI